MPQALRLTTLAETFAISKLAREAPVPRWACSGGWWNVTRTDEELSIVCPEVQVPVDITSNRGWKCLKVEGCPDRLRRGLATFQSRLEMSQSGRPAGPHTYRYSCFSLGTSGRGSDRCLLHFDI